MLVCAQEAVLFTYAREVAKAYPHAIIRIFDNCNTHDVMRAAIDATLPGEVIVYLHNTGNCTDTILWIAAFVENVSQEFELHGQEWAMRNVGKQFHTPLHDTLLCPVTPFTGRLLVLVIASHTEEYDEFKRMWRERTHPLIDIYFMYGNPEQTCDIVAARDDLFAKAPESLVPGILMKTQLCLRHMLKDACKWTHVLRTNLSSFYIWDRYLNWLGQYQAHTHLLGAISGMYAGTPFCSGAGFVMSVDAARYLAHAPWKDSYEIHPDDVCAYHMLVPAYVPNLLYVPRLDYSDNVSISEQTAHIRLFGSPRLSWSALLNSTYYPRKFTHVALACNSHPAYLACLPWACKAWLKLGVIPIVGLVNVATPPCLPGCLVLPVAAPEDTPLCTAFVSQVCRLLLPTMLPLAPSDRVLISDVDMMPTSAAYFHRPVPEDGVLAVFRTDIYKQWGMVPMCYVGGSQDVWRSLFPESFDTLAVWWKEQQVQYGTPWDAIGQGWFFDQTLLTLRVQQYAHVRWWTDAELGFKRMCRSDQSTLTDITGFIAKGGTDYSMVREGDAVNELAAAVLARIVSA
jgi:hypothetical protein